MPVIRRSTRTTRGKIPGFTPYEYGPAPQYRVNRKGFFNTKTKPRQPIINDPHPDVWPATPAEMNGYKYDTWRWKDTPRPAYWLGTWPPESAFDLLTTTPNLSTLTTAKQQRDFEKVVGTLQKDDCLGKYCWQTASWRGSTEYPCAASLDGRAICDHNLTEWLQGMSTWKTRFEIQHTPSTGYGLFSRQAWTRGDVLGIYLGELLPARTQNTDYCHEIAIGPTYSKVGSVVAYVDAEKCGSYVRFCNHSCEANANISEARVGEQRVLALRAVRDIAAGEQVCIDYMEDYFRERKCLCGLQTCRYTGTDGGVAGGDGK
ncbi:hypothetical protein ACN47E_002854 [Coniothyrium glycines]